MMNAIIAGAAGLFLGQTISKAKAKRRRDFLDTDPRHYASNQIGKGVQIEYAKSPDDMVTVLSNVLANLKSDSEYYSQKRLTTTSMDASEEETAAVASEDVIVDPTPGGMS